MTYPDDQNVPGTHPQPATDAESASAVTVSEERLRVSTQWVQSGRVRLRRQVVTETRSVEVTLRREELVAEVVDAAGAAETDAAETGAAETGAAEIGAHGAGGAGDLTATHEPMVFVLHEEFPQITIGGIRAYERVTAHVDVAVSEHSVGGRLRREQADVEVIPAADSDSPPSTSQS